jgi:hypothetical protein
MARETGLEPAASAVTGRRSNQLSYSRKISITRVRTATRVSRAVRYGFGRGKSSTLTNIRTWRPHSPARKTQLSVPRSSSLKGLVLELSSFRDFAGAEAHAGEFGVVCQQAGSRPRARGVPGLLLAFRPHPRALRPCTGLRPHFPPRGRPHWRRAVHDAVGIPVPQNHRRPSHQPRPVLSQPGC